MEAISPDFQYSPDSWLLGDRIQAEEQEAAISRTPAQEPQ